MTAGCRRIAVSNGQQPNASTTPFQNDQLTYEQRNNFPGSQEPLVPIPLGLS